MRRNGKKASGSFLKKRTKKLSLDSDEAKKIINGGA
jgi:hypothetical protein